MARTAHFEIFAEWDDENLLGLARLLEQGWTALLATVWPAQTQPPPLPVQVVAVWQLQRYAGAGPNYLGGLTAWSLGERQTGQSNLILLNLNAGSSQYVGFVANHEVTHLLTNLLVQPNLPSWLDEGLASYHEAMVFEPDKVTVGAITRGRLQSLRAVPRVPLERFFGQRFPLDDMDAYSVLSTNSFLLVHYLLSEHHDRFRTFQSRLLGGEPWLSAWTDQFGPVDQIALDEQLVGYWKARKLPTRDINVRFDSPPVETKVLPMADVHAVRALLYRKAVGPMLDTERQARARAELERSFALDPSNDLAVEFGWPYLSPAELRERAFIAWRSRPDDWRAAILAARAADPRSAVEILETTRGRHPQLGYVEAALAVAYLGTGDNLRARQVARLAVEHQPGDSYLLGIYAQCLLLSGGCETVRYQVEVALADAEKGQRFPYDLPWLNRACAAR